MGSKASHHGDLTLLFQQYDTDHNNRWSLQEFLNIAPSVPDITVAGLKGKEDNSYTHTHTHTHTHNNAPHTQCTTHTHTEELAGQEYVKSTRASTQDPEITLTLSHKHTKGLLPGEFNTRI